MSRQSRWKDLRIGALATCGIIAAALLILVFGRVGVLHGRKFTFHVTTDAARGVIRGTDVWLDGKKVGVVSGVSFRPPSAPLSDRLVITLSVLERERSRIRKDSQIQVRSGGSIIGDRVVNVNSGSATAPEVVAGDTIHAHEQADIEGVASDAAIASREIPGILENVKLLAAQLRTAEGTLGALGLETGNAQLSKLGEKTRKLLDELTQSKGTLAKAGAGMTSLGERARSPWHGLIPYVGCLLRTRIRLAAFGATPRCSRRLVAFATSSRSCNNSLRVRMERLGVSEPIRRSFETCIAISQRSIRSSPT
jgi:ABC-type transporter Mla subunit MlaD